MLVQTINIPAFLKHVLLTLDYCFLVYHTYSEITGFGEVGATASSNEIFDDKVGGIGEGEETVTSLRNNEGECLVTGTDEGVGLKGVA